jgi:hypothetical protein
MCHTFLVCVMYLLFVLCNYVVLICVAVTCPDTTPLCVACIAVLAVFIDYDYSLWLALLLCTTLLQLWTEN